MSKSEQMERKMECGVGDDEKMREKASVEGLPLESSPYVKYTDLEDYKRKAYGTEGHLQPKPHHTVGTDAPTLSGTDVPPEKQADKID